MNRKDRQKKVNEILRFRSVRAVPEVALATIGEMFGDDLFLPMANSIKNKVLTELEDKKEDLLFIISQIEGAISDVKKVSERKEPVNKMAVVDGEQVDWDSEDAEHTTVVA